MPGDYPGRAGRSRRPGDLPRPRPDRRLSAGRPAPPQARRARVRPPHRAGADRHARRPGTSSPCAVTAHRACTSAAPRSPRSACACAAAAPSTAWRSTWPWTWSRSIASIPAAIRACGDLGARLGRPGDRWREVEAVLIGELARQFGLHAAAAPTRTSPFPPRATPHASLDLHDRRQIHSACRRRRRRRRGSRKAARRGQDRAQPRRLRPTRRCCASPSWIRVRIPPGNAVAKLKAKLRENRLVTVCEEAAARTSTSASATAPRPS